MNYKVKKDSTILKFLQEVNQGWSKKKIKSLLSFHAILLNGKVLKRLEDVVKEGQTVTIKEKQKEVKDKRLKILYEDEYFIAVNKPYGMLSVSDHTKEETMYQIVNHYVKTNEKKRIYVLHRLDKDTSGVLVFVKDEKMKYRMQEKWNDYVSVREYYAVVEGTGLKKGTYQSYLNETSTYYVYSSKEGKKAITHYETLKEGKHTSLVRVNLETGRKNQIRVHMMELHHPIVGDKKYGSKMNPMKRLGLHARKLEFLNPVTKKHVIIEAPIPNEFQKLI